MRRRKAGTCIVIHIRVSLILALHWRVPVVRPLLATCGAAGASQQRTGPRRPAVPAARGMPEGTPPSIAANITSHPTAGIGGWTDAEISRAITHGVGRDGHPLKPPMAYAFYAGLKPAHLADIVAYLRTVPPLQ